MQTNNALEKGLGHRGCCVRVTESQEMSLLREAINHGQNNTLAMDTGQTFDKIHCDAGPHLSRHIEGLQ